MSNTRLQELDLAKGLAILLVVWGHVVAGAHPRGDQWYLWSQQAVYLFHMPFFMFLSGTVAGYGYRPVAGLAPWLAFVRGKMARLMPAYLLIGVLIVAGKLLASRVVYVDNIPGSLWGGIGDVLWQPDRSSSKSLWFIYVLFLFYVALHPLLALLGQRAAALIALGLLLHWVPGPEWLMLNRFCQFFVFFALGFGAGRHYEAVMARIDRHGRLALLLFGAALSAVMVWQPDEGKLIVGMFSIPALMYLVRNCRPGRWTAPLLTAGRYSFVIYLLNTICIGVAKAIGFKIGSWDGAHFLLFAPALFLAGVLGPIWIKRHLLRRVPPLDRMTR